MGYVTFGAKKFYNPVISLARPDRNNRNRNSFFLFFYVQQSYQFDSIKYLINLFFYKLK